MTGKKPFKSSGGTTTAVRPAQRRQRVTGGIVIPEDEKQHLVAAAAYFRAARYRNIGADGCRKDDVCDAAIELEAVLRRHCAPQ